MIMVPARQAQVAGRQVLPSGWVTCMCPGSSTSCSCPSRPSRWRDLGQWF